MKKVFSLIIILAALFAGCGEKDSPSPPPEPQTPTFSQSALSVEEG